MEQIPCDSYLPDNPSAGGNNGGSQSDSGEPDDPGEDEDDDPASIGVDLVPNLDLTEPEDLECEYLRKMLGSTSIRSEIDFLRRNVDEDDFERIVEFTEDLNGVALPKYKARGTTNVPSVPPRNLPNDIIRRVFIHTHFGGDNGELVPMFSYSDLEAFLRDVVVVSGRGKDPSEMTSILIAADVDTIFTYMIKKDPNSSIANNYLLHQQQLGMTVADRKAEKDDYEQLLSRADGQDARERIALEQLEKMGLHLYTTSEGLSELKRLTLNRNNLTNPNDSSLGDPIPCE
ncbi:MAG: hypothetical protein WBG46_04835 [Nonlabens sp.]